VNLDRPGSPERLHERARTDLATDPVTPSRATANLISRPPIGVLDVTALPPDIVRNRCEPFRIAVAHDSGCIDRQARIEAGTINHQRDHPTGADVQICDVPPDYARST
jgi:hypothetical protein